MHVGPHLKLENSSYVTIPLLGGVHDEITLLRIRA